jgi:hypothetical protein
MIAGNTPGWNPAKRQWRELAQKTPECRGRKQRGKLPNVVVVSTAGVGQRRLVIRGDPLDRLGLPVEGHTAIFAYCPERLAMAR